jgi:transcriptional regulator with XRE-family HTH domain
MTTATFHNTTTTAPNHFGGLLRSWRDRRKRSQLDLSLEAGVSQRHLSFLESGRAKPSRDMILQLADVLDVPLRDRNLLLHAAGFAAAYQARQLDSTEMAAVRKALDMTLQHHEPYPALVMDKQWNLILQNDAATRFLGLLGNIEDVWRKIDPSGNRNIMQLTFHPNGLQPLINNWRDVASLLLTRLQREITADPSNQALSNLFQQLCDLPDVTSQRHCNIMLSAPEPILPLEFNFNGACLKIFSMISTFGTALDVTADELRVETFFPADDFSAQFFRMLQQKQA